MELKNKDFFSSNYIALIVAGLVVAYYLYTALSGGRICDCDTTQKSTAGSESSGRTHYSGVHYYHHK